MSVPIPASSHHSTSRYYLFDPHSRPQLGLDGAYLASSELEEDILQRLNDLFPPLPVDDYDYGDGGGDYSSNGSGNMGAMMYNMFECWIFQVNE